MTNNKQYQNRKLQLQLQRGTTLPINQEVEANSELELIVSQK